MRRRKKASLTLAALVLSLGLGVVTPALGNDAQVESPELSLIPKIIEQVMDFVGNILGGPPPETSPDEDRSDRGRDRGNEDRPGERGPTADPDGHSRKNS